MDETTDDVTLAFGQSFGIWWWDDPRNPQGFDPRSNYVERFWLPILGPSATLMLRYFARHLDGQTRQIKMDLATVARDLGLGDRTGRHAPFMRTIARTIDFNMTKFAAPDLLCVRRYLPMLRDRQVARLSEPMRLAHATFINAQLGADPASALEQRGRQLALSLLALDKPAQDVERQLIAWRFSPALSHSCVVFASFEHRRRIAADKADPAVPLRSARLTASSCH